MTSTEDTRPTVLVLASTYPRWRGDPEPGFVHELCRRLTQHFQVIAVVPDAPGADRSGHFEGVEVLRYRYAPRFLQTLVNNGGVTVNLRRSAWKWLLVPFFVLGQYLAARRVLRSRPVAVIHAHWLLPQGWLARHFSKRHHVPFLVTSHGGDLFGLRGAMLNRAKQLVAQASTGMTVVSRAMAEEVERLGLQPPRLTVIPMGVDLRQRFTPDPAQTRNPGQLLFVGRLVPKKGLTHLLEAMPAVVEARPDVSVLIAGFGPEQAALEAQTHRLGLSRHVTFLGATSQAELPALYRQSALFVAPFVRAANGDQEGLPVALMEAIGCGCPAIVGHVLGIEDLLGDKVSEVSVNPRDIPALSKAILSSLDHPDESAARASAIRKAALQHVDWHTIGSAYAEELAACMKAQGDFTPDTDSRAP